MAKRQAAVVLVLLMCSLAFTSVSSSTTEVVDDEARMLVHGEPGGTWTTTLDVEASQTGLFVVSCASCESTVLDAQGTTVQRDTGGLHLMRSPEVSEQMTLRIDFTEQDTADVLVFASTMD
ncbi:MAG: hypothetical protein ACPHCZ_03195, partial [Candidatus Poseidoniaceae archaeon]